jgi:hypothetical protein
LLAVTHRNLGECLIDLERINTEDRWREAESHFRTSLHIENKINPYSRLISEIYYQLARLRAKESKPSLARKELENCISTAEEGHNGLVASIAKNRLLWLDVKEKNLRWRDIAERVDLIGDSLGVRQDHSWAARTKINSNINLAHLLIKEDLHEVAAKLLEENLEVLKKNKDLRREGDLIRIMSTLGGILFISEMTGYKIDYKALIKREYPEVEKYFQEKGYHTLSEVWDRSFYYGYS